MRPLYNWLIILLLTTATTPAKASIVGYYPEYRTGSLPINQIRYDYLDHIIYFSIAPNTNGSLDTSGINISNLQTLATTAHSQSTIVSICIGGWGRSGNFSAMAGNATSRANFVANLTQFCIDNDLDGADLDWEPVSSGADRNRYTTLIQDLNTAFTPHDFRLTVAAASWGNEFNASAISNIDALHVMAYDMGIPHSSYADAISTLAHWESFGFPPEKLFLGVPFYGRDTSTAYTYKYIIDTYAPGPGVDLVDGINFNGINTIVQKAEFVCAEPYAGIMIWEIGQDTSDATSLLTALNESLDYSLCALPCDLDLDGDVDTDDLILLAANWLTPGAVPGNCYADARVDILDLALMAQKWLKTAP